MSCSNQIPPVEIEAVLLNHPDISEVCVVGYPDEQYGELPRAYIVKKPGSKLTEEDVNNLVLGKLCTVCKCIFKTYISNVVLNVFL